MESKYRDHRELTGITELHCQRHMEVHEPASSYDPIPSEVNRIGTLVVEACTRVHSALGPGLLESAYKACLLEELSSMGVTVWSEVAVPVIYGSTKLDVGFRLDILVERCVIVEVKAVDALHPVHQAQVLTYLKLTGHRLAYLVNFNVPLVKDGIRRFVH